MRKLMTIFLILSVFFCNSQELNDVNEIVNLAKIYRGNHGLKSLDESSKSIFDKYEGTKFEKVSNFIQELTKPKNRIIESEFLTRPDSTSLKIFHTIIMVNYNMYEKNPDDNEKIAKKFLRKDVITNEQLKQYYSSLFVSVINKNRPFDYSNQNWNLNKLGLVNDKEQAVFFLVFMDKLGSQVSHYLNAMRGSNWDGIEKYVKLLPKVNGKQYHQFDAFYFKDFKMDIYKKNRNFKDYYIPKFYDILVAHILMMEEKNYEKEDITDFLLTSILSQEQFYDYCNRMDVIKKYLTKKE